MNPHAQRSEPSPDPVIPARERTVSVHGMPARSPDVVRRVLVLEGAAPTGESIRTALAALFPQAALHVASNPTQAHLMLYSVRPHLALLDLNAAERFLPYIARQALAQDPPVRWVAVAGHEDDDRILPALRAGASGFLLRREPSDAQSKRLRAALLGVVPLDAALARQILRQCQCLKPPAALSDLERALLSAIAEGDTPTRGAERIGMTAAMVGPSMTSIFRKAGLTPDPAEPA